MGHEGLDGCEPSRIDGAATPAAMEPTRTDATSTDGGEQIAPGFLDPILRGLLAAQGVWLATREPASLRRELIAILAALG